MRTLKNIAFLMEDLAVPSPAQQLLDRFLAGFSRNGVIERPQCRVSAWCAQDSSASALRERHDAFGLVPAPTAQAALAEAQAVIVTTPGQGFLPAEILVRLAIDAAPAGTPIFVHGLLASSQSAATELVQRAKARESQLIAGTALPGTFRLPDVDLAPGTRLREALIVVQGEFASAEFNALEGLLPVLERRKSGEAGVRKLRFFEGEGVWQAGHDGQWSWPLLAAAISRSHTPQGNPVLDGRTEDLVGLGLLPSLAKNPRGWLLEHKDGLRSALLVLDGVVADFNFAVRAARDTILSAQLFRPPAPQQEHYSRLAGTLVDFFTTSRPPWSVERSLLEVQLLAAMASPNARSGEWMPI